MILGNPIFEQTPVDLVTVVISDVGLLGADLAPGVCADLQTPEMLRALDELIG